MRVKLSDNFYLDEFTKTSYDVGNNPEQSHVNNLFLLCNYIIQPIRYTFGRIDINSGFRSEKLERIVAKLGYERWLAKNDLNDSSENWKAYLKNKQHPKGEAADIVPYKADIEEVFEYVRYTLIYGQLILEEVGNSRWIHVSLAVYNGPFMDAKKFNGTNYVKIGR